MAERLPIFFGAVLVLSFLLLMVVFRSLLVPLKAVIMNLLSIGAAYGIVVALFQWGWLSDLTGVQPAPIEPWMPMMLFAIVFGLSMDYEVFLLSRVREEWHRTGDSRTSVADGLAATAKVITAAAAIMVVVFGSFLLENDRIFKLMGTGLADGDPPRRHHRPHAAGARHHGAARRQELVAAALARPAPPPRRRRGDQRRRSPRRRSARTCPPACDPTGRLVRRYGRCSSRFMVTLSRFVSTCQPGRRVSHRSDGANTASRSVRRWLSSCRRRCWL